jgi:hypothetical protein
MRRNGGHYEFSQQKNPKNHFRSYCRNHYSDICFNLCSQRTAIGRISFGIAGHASRMLYAGA